MQAMTSTGLTGKARLARERSRTTRLHVQQWIDEYVDPDHDPGYIREKRFIPIRGKREFLPSVAACMVDASGLAGSQLDLPFERASCETDRDARRAARSAGSPSTDAASDSGNQVESRSRETRPPASAPMGGPVGKRSANLTLGGFLCGCAMGGAAAAVILLILQVTLF